VGVIDWELVGHYEQKWFDAPTEGTSTSPSGRTTSFAHSTIPPSGPGNMHAIELAGSFGDEELFAREMNWRVLTAVGCQGWPRLGKLTLIEPYHCFLHDLITFS
jgi:hypothetical protein